MYELETRVSQKTFFFNFAILFGPECNVKLKVLATFRLLVYKFETFCGVSIQFLAALVQKELQN